MSDDDLREEDWKVHDGCPRCAEYAVEVMGLNESLELYIRGADQAWSTAAEQRRRRMAIEEELHGMVDMFVNREPLIEVRYYEPKRVSPHQITRETIKHTRFGPEFVDRTVLVDVPGPAVERQAGFFGRLGDRLDRLWRAP